MTLSVGESVDGELDWLRSGDLKPEGSQIVRIGEPL